MSQCENPKRVTLLESIHKFLSQKRDCIFSHHTHNPHPANVGRWEWLTNRELNLELIEQTIVTDSERLTDEDIAEIRRKQKERGEESFAE